MSVYNSIQASVDHMSVVKFCVSSTTCKRKWFNHLYSDVRERDENRKRPNKRSSSVAIRDVTSTLSSPVLAIRRWRRLQPSQLPPKPRLRHSYCAYIVCTESRNRKPKRKGIQCQRRDEPWQIQGHQVFPPLKKNQTNWKIINWIRIVKKIMLHSLLWSHWKE